jgi:hypothetical protein
MPSFRCISNNILDKKRQLHALNPLGRGDMKIVRAPLELIGTLALLLLIFWERLRVWETAIGGTLIGYIFLWLIFRWIEKYIDPWLKR